MIGCENMKRSTKSTGSAQVASRAVSGMHGGMTVEVTLSDRRIEKVVVKAQNGASGVSDTGIAPWAAPRLPRGPRSMKSGARLFPGSSRPARTAT